MSNTPDPLKLLVRALSHKQEVQMLAQDGTTVVDQFPDCHLLSFPGSGPTSERIVLPKNTLTRYKKDGSDEFYDLESLFYAFVKADLGPSQYIQSAMQDHVAFAPITQRQKLLDYVKGERQGGDEIAPMESGAQKVESTTQATEHDQDRPAKRPKYHINEADRDAVKQLLAFQETKQLVDKDTVLRGNKPANFEFVRTLVADRIKMAREEFTRLEKAGHGAAPASGSVAPLAKTPGQLHPIIIISPSSSALITMHNVKKFLEEASFEPTASRIAQGLKVMENFVTINHKRQIGTSTNSAAASRKPADGSSLGIGAERTARYYVVDSVEALNKLGEDAWDRVVCVMTTGQEWQFRPYKWPEPKELFHHVKGIYVSWSNDLPNPKIKNWNVTELKLDPAKRHIDKSVAAEFWRVLESWIAINKPYVAW